MKNQFIELFILTRNGRFVAHYSDKGLAELDFPNGRAELRRDRDARRGVPAGIPDRIRGWHRRTEFALKKILGGNEPTQFPPLDLAGTEFQKGVWNALRKIPLGKTRSYGEIAKQIGKPKAVRAVGGACGANPIPVLIPCHRVLAANKKPGGFSSGLRWKRALLAREGVSI